MPVQKTFTVIPVPGADAVHTPTRPMTSKQVRKAYSAAHRTPRVSRAEQLKLERAEQERIRKELEKEKASTKARSAREKKKQKESAEREDKKRKRLPLVNVRPSQDTIARFVRGNSKKATKDEPPREDATRNEPADMLGSIAEEDDEDQIKEPRKRPCTKSGWIPKDDVEPRKSQNETVLRAELYIHPDDGIGRELFPGLEKGLHAELDLLPNDDLDLEALLEDRERPIEEAKLPDSTSGQGFKKQTNNPHMESDLLLDDDLDLESLLQSQNKPLLGSRLCSEDGLPSQKCRKGTRPDTEVNVLPDDDVDLEVVVEPRTVDARRKVAQQVLHTRSELLPDDTFEPKAVFKPPTKAHAEMDLLLEDDFDEMLEDLELATQRPQKRAASPGHNCDQRKRRRSTTYEEDLGLAASLSKKQCPQPRTETPSPPRQAPPMSTQAILFNFDDFFPTASQQARELQEESDTASQLNPSPVKLSPQLPPIPKQAPSPPAPSRRFFTSSGSHEQMSVAMHLSRRSAALDEMHRKDKMRREAGVLAKQQQRSVTWKQSVHKPAHKARVVPETTRQVVKGRQSLNERPARGMNGKPVPLMNEKTSTPMNGNATKPMGGNTPLETRTKPVTKPTNLSSGTTKAITTNKPLHPPPSKTTEPQPALQPQKENIIPASSSASQETEYGGGWVDDIALELMI